MCPPFQFPPDISCVLPLHANGKDAFPQRVEQEALWTLPPVQINGGRVVLPCFWAVQQATSRTHKIKADRHIGAAYRPATEAQREGDFERNEQGRSAAARSRSGERSAISIILCKMRSESDLAPRTHSEFREKSYWEEFFTKRKSPFEWCLFIEKQSCKLWQQIFFYLA